MLYQKHHLCTFWGKQCHWCILRYCMSVNVFSLDSFNIYFNLGSVRETVPILNTTHKSFLFISLYILLCTSVIVCSLSDLCIWNLVFCRICWCFCMPRPEQNIIRDLEHEGEYFLIKSSVMHSCVYLSVCRIVTGHVMDIYRCVRACVRVCDVRRPTSALSGAELRFDTLKPLRQ